AVQPHRAHRRFALLPCRHHTAGSTDRLPHQAQRRQTERRELMSYIAVENVHKHYNATSVLRGFTLAVDRHEVACLIGPSGCGKSTVLRCINGLERIDAGDIRVGNITVSEELADTNTLRR